MRLAIFSDLHANALALQRCWKDLTALKDDCECWCLGDLCGYGPDAVETVSMAREAFVGRLVPGNHDLIETYKELNNLVLPVPDKMEKFFPKMDEILGPTRISALMTGFFHRYELRQSRELWEWFQESITSQQTLRQVDFGSHRAYFMHSPFKNWENYAHPWKEEVLKSFGRVLLGEQQDLGIHPFPDKPAEGVTLAFSGHTHIPMLAVLLPGSKIPKPLAIRYGERRPLENGVYLVNPGSVGQPRDGDPRPCYAMLDLPEKGPPTLEFRRPGRFDTGDAAILSRMHTRSDVWRDQLSNDNILSEEEDLILRVYINHYNRKDKRTKIRREIERLERETPADEISLQELHGQLGQLTNTTPVEWAREIRKMREEMKSFLCGSRNHQDALEQVYHLSQDGLEPVASA